MRGKHLFYRIEAVLGAGGEAQRLPQWLMPDVVTVGLYGGLVDAPLPVPSTTFLSVKTFAR
jgi:hypothetical protein